MSPKFGKWMSVGALVGATVTAVVPSVVEAAPAASPAVSPAPTVLPTPTAASPALTSLSPQRFADTRPGALTVDGAYSGNGRLAAGSEYKVKIAGRGAVPAGATGAILNIAAVQPGDLGFFTVHPCAARPNASALNYTAGVTIANEVVAALSTDGSVCVFTSAESHLLIDVVGFTKPSDTLKTLSPQRFADSRLGSETFDGQFEGLGRRVAGSTTRIRIAGRGTVPADAAAAVVNVAAVRPDVLGFVTVHACLPTPPNASSLNVVPGVNRANELVAQLDAAGDICIYTFGGVDLIVDVVGYVEDGSDLVGVPNQRYLETRDGSTFDGISQGGGPLAAGSTTTVTIAGRGAVPSDAVAAVVNVAAVRPDGPGFATVYPCDSRPNASSLNYVAGVNSANEIIARLDGLGRLCLYTSAQSHFIMDVVGYLEPNADLTIAKDGGVSSVIVGDTITYTVEVTNRGPDRAANVGVSDVLPADVTFVSTTGCAQDPTGVPECTLGDIAAGATASFTIAATIDRSAFGSITNTASVVSSTGDPDLTNNTAVEVTGVNNLPPVITSNGGGANAVVLVAENQTSVTDVQATDHEGDTENGGGLTYALTTSSGGGVDNGRFGLVAATGVLTFNAAPNFEAPADGDTDNHYEVQVTVTDSRGLQDVQNITVTVTNVNEAPVIFSDGGGATAAIGVPENTTAVTDVDTADVDGDTEGAGLTYSLTTVAGGGEDNGLFTLDPVTGELGFTTAPDFELPADDDIDNDYEVQVTVTDSGGLTDVQDVIVTVTDGNEAPTITSGGGATTAAVNVPENTTAVTDVDAIDDSDTEGDGLTYSLTPTPASPDNDLFVLDADTGELSFAVPPDFEMPGDLTSDNVYVVQVTVTDSGGLSDLQNILVTVTDVNDEGPVALDDGYDALEDEQLVVAAPGVLDNDTDPESDVLSVVVPSVTTSAEGGTVVLSSDGSFTYDPPADFFGEDSFTYQAIDAAGSNTASNEATVTITVGAVNDAPSFAAGEGPVVVLEDSSPYSAPWATDVTAGPGEVQILDFVVTANTNPGLFATGPDVSASGVLVFTPAADANGSATVTFVLTDNGGGDDTSASVDLTIEVTAVNDAPSFTKGSNVIVGEDSGAYAETGWATDISAGPADESFDPAPSFTVTATNTALFAAQPAVSAAGELTFTPAANANGTTFVSVRLSDGGGTDDGGVETSAPQGFFITITAVNDAPVAVADGYTVVEGESLTVPSGPLVGVRDNDTDVEDGTPPTGDVALVTPPAHHVGAFVLNPDGSFTYVHDGSESPTTDSFTYRVTDSAGALSNVGTVTITITPVNETPVAVDDGYDAFEDTLLEVAAPGVLGNDTDAEADELSVVVPTVTTSAEGGVVTLDEDGSFTYDPPEDFFGTDSFTYEATDGNSDSGTATVTITVAPVNDAPTFTLTESPDQTVFEDAAAQTVADFLTDTDAGAANESTQTVTVSVTNDNNALFSVQPAIDADTGELTYTPAPDANGEAIVTVSVSDDGGTANGGDDTSDPQTFTITIDPVNDEPSFTKGGDVVVSEDSGPYGPTPWATAISVGPANEADQTPSFTVAATNTALFSVQPAVSAAGGLSFTPAPNANGATLVTVFVRDDGGLPGDDTSPSQTFEITITPTNDPPVVVLTTPLVEYVEGDGAVPIDAGPASFTVTDVDSALLSGLTVAISAGAETGVDELACPACAGLGIIASFSSVSNTLTLVGPASPAAYQTALRSITFENDSNTPSGADRELTVIATDDVAASEPATMEFSFVVTGDIVIVKDADPDDPQDFEFTEDITGGTFSLDDDLGSPLPNSVFFADVVPGTYTVTESPVEGWDLTGLNCTDADSTGDTLTRTATIIVDADELVTCTFTNDNRGTITLVKDTDPDDAQDFEFSHEITAIPAVASPVTLDDDADAPLPNTQIFENVSPGVYTITETPVEGWDLSDIECTGGASTFTYGEDGLVFTPGDTSVTIALAFGDDDVRCTFTNTEQGTIEIVKETVGGDGAFDFTENIPGGEGSFTVETIENTGDVTFPDVAPGTYTVREFAPEAGWDLTGIECTSDGGSTFTFAGATASPTTGFEPGDNRATITLAPGDDTATCTFTNTERGSIDVTKTTVGGTGEFSFTEDTTGDELGFDLDTSEGPATQQLTEVAGEGTYTISETVPEGWDVTGIVCSADEGGSSGFRYLGGPDDVDDEVFEVGDTSVEIELAAGDDVGCSFENTKRGTIVIGKVTIGGDGEFEFTDDTEGDPLGDFSIATEEGEGGKTFENVLPGTYTVAETAQEGWDLTGLICFDPGDGGTTFDLGDGEATIDLDPGEAVICTFENTKRGTIEIVKDADPDDAQDFGFSLVADSEGAIPTLFTLDDDDDPVLSNTESFENVLPGSYTVTEDDPTPGFDLTDLECVDPDEGSSVDLEAGAATIDLDPGETVTCTFTNTKRGTIKIVKTAVGGDGEFDFTDTIPGSGSFSIGTTDGTATETFENILSGSYTVTESAEEGWDLTGLTCVDPDDGSSILDATATIDLDPGETVSCTFTNTKRGTIEIVKDAVGDDGTFNFTDDTLDAPLGDFVIVTTEATTARFADVVPGTYAITEAAQEGWDLTDLTCDDENSTTSDATATIELDPGETVSCTFENTKRGTIVVEKDPIGGDGVFEFTDGTVDAPLGDFSIDTTEATTETFENVVPDTYTISEIGQEGWDLTGLTCVDPDEGSGVSEATATIDLDPGETVSCTFTNTKRGTIEIVKDTIGGNATFSFDEDVTLTGTFDLATEAGTASTTFENVVPDTYTISEMGQEGWDLTGLECVDPDEGSSILDATATIDLDAGETVSCTFTNTKRGTIEIVKTAIGGNATFTFAEDIPSETETFDLTTISGAAATTFENVQPATYRITENATEGWALASIECTSTGGSTFSYGADYVDITLAAGDDSVSCEFINIAEGTIEIVKDTVPDSTQSFGFTENIAGPASSFTLVDDGVNPNNVLFGSVGAGTYTVTETPVAGWDLASIECIGSAVFVYGPASATITFASSTNTASCTFTNVERGNITIVEDEDTLPVIGQNFTFDEDIRPGNFQLDDDADLALPNSRAFLEVVPGTYTVSQRAELGWDLNSIECTSTGGSTFSYTGAAGGTDAFEPGDDTAVISLAPGDDDVSCTFTNDNKGTIQIIKDALGDDEVLFAFTDTVPTGTGSFSLNASPGSNVEIFEGVIPGTYSITETVPASGWDLTGIECTTAGPTGFAYTGNGGVDTAAFEPGDDTVSITLAGADDTVSCTFTNTERGTIDITKEAVGGDGTFDFTDNVAEPGEFTLTTPDDATEPFTEVLTGTYTISEIVPDNGWDLTSITCTANGGTSTFGYDGASVDIDLAPGDDVDCTFTNTARGTIDVTKTTVGGDGEFDFTDTIDALGEFRLTTPDDASEPFTEVEPGVYNVAEAPARGWDVTGITCTSGTDASTFRYLGGPDDVDDTAFESGDTSVEITLAAGDDVDCSFENTQHGSIHGLKFSDTDADGAYGDEAGIPDVEFTLTGDALSSPVVTTTDEGGEFHFEGLAPGTYTVTETVPDGYTPTTPTSVEVTIAAGEEAVAFAGQAELTPTQFETVNTDLLFGNAPNGKIVIVKDADPDGPQEFAFTEDITGPEGVFTLVDDGEADNRATFLDVPFGRYTVAETPVPDGWDLTGVSCVDPDEGSSGDVGLGRASIDLDPGETVTCTFTNTRRGTILVAKQTLPAGDPATFEFDGAVTATLADGQTSEPVEVQPGEHTVTETVPDGWDLTKIVCDDLNSSGDTEGGTATFNVEPGETVTCTFINTKDAFIIVDKVTDPSGDEAEFDFDASWLTDPEPGPGDFTLTDAAVPFDSGDLDPGSYWVAELEEDGWDLTATSCVSSIGDTEMARDIRLAAGETVTCTFTNTKRGSIVVEKVAVGGDGTFSFTEDITEVGSFTIDTDETDSVPFDNLLPGTYVVAETALPESWDLTNLECTSTNGNSTFSLTGSDVDTGDYELGDDTATIDLAPGDDVTCTFTNTDQRGTINVTKDPGDSFGAFEFAETITEGGSFLLFADEEPVTRPFPDVDPGTYFVTESPVPGWVLTDITCTSSRGVSSFVYSGATESPTAAFEPGDHTVRITLGAGDDDVDCTFTNLDLRGSIEIVADSVPDDEQSFEFTHDIVDPGPIGPFAFVVPSFSLVDDGTGEGDTRTFPRVVPGETHSVTQTAVPGWELTNIVCASSGGSTFAYTGANADPAFQPGDTTAEITLAPLDVDVSCTFTNTDRRGTIVIVEDSVPDSPQEFAFTEDIPGPEGVFTLVDDAGLGGDEATHSNTITFPDVVPGTYTVIEGFVPNWVVSGLNCDDANSVGSTGTRTATIRVEGNETVTCTFTNTLVALIR